MNKTLLSKLCIPPFAEYIKLLPDCEILAPFMLIDPPDIAPDDVAGGGSSSSNNNGNGDDNE